MAHFLAAIHISAAVDDFLPVHEVLMSQAADGDVVHNDDTSVKILERMGARAKLQALGASLDEETKQNAAERTGLFTAGVVAERVRATCCILCLSRASTR